MKRDEIYDAMKKNIGIVPGWVQEIPDGQLEGFWKSMSEFEMADTAIPAKYKDLIALAVSSQIPCGYCVEWHKSSARANGADAREIREAIGMAANVRMGSAIVNGAAPDMETFKGEVETIMAHMQEHTPMAPP